MAEEALACFTSIENNVPQWLADLDNILNVAAATQDGLKIVHNTVNILSQTSQSKSSSLKSSRSKDAEESNGQPQDERQIAARRLHRPSLRRLASSEFLRLIQRKRKPTTSISSDSASETQKFQTKTTAVIYYDGDTQKRLEQLVRTVGATRNTIRKGKMSAKIEALARTGSSSSNDGYSSGGEIEDSWPLSGGFAMNLSGKQNKPSQLPVFGSSDNSALFDRLGGYLEKAQALCERAAHQILRDGDCTTEMNEAKEQFRLAHAMATAELPELRRRAQRAVQRKIQTEERRRVEREAEEQRRKSAAHVTPRVMPVVVPVVIAATPVPTTIIHTTSTTIIPTTNDSVQVYETRIEADVLEVDDGTDDDEEFNITSMQFSKFSHLRNNRRLPAY